MAELGNMGGWPYREYAGHSIDNALRRTLKYRCPKEVSIMNKTTSISIRISEDELAKLKKAAELEAYSSYSEFVRRTALKEAIKIIKNNSNNEENGGNN